MFYIVIGILIIAAMGFGYYLVTHVDQDLVD